MPKIKLGTPKKLQKAIDELSKETNYPKVDIELLVPNTWNPNVMAKEDMKKLKTNIQDTLDAAGTIPPTVVRPHPKEDGKYEIIDGYHRTEVMKQLGHETIPVCIMHVDTKRAMRLTETLNHLRGTNDPTKYVTYLEQMLEQGETLKELESFLPDTAEDMEALMRAQNVKLDDVMISGEKEEEEKETTPENTWVELKFRVSQPMAEVVEAEIARISSVLEGGNVRGRALEFMAVNSADTPLKSITGETDDGEPKSVKKLKKKLKMRARRPEVELGEAD